jgi:hypothetical protein
LKIRLTDHGRERFHDRIGFLPDDEIIKFIRNYQGGDFKFIFGPARGERGLVLITVKYSKELLNDKIQDIKRSGTDDDITVC